MQEYKLKRLLQDSLQSIRPVPPSANNYTPVEPGVVKFPLKGTFIGQNGKGDEIYAMQPDHMPCLVPNKEVQLNMPVAGNSTMDKGLLPLLSKPR